jgi:OOP family OmpA-OmpF porin
MNKLLCSTMLLAAALAAPAVRAADTYYMGAGIGTRGTLYLDGPAGKLENTNHPRPFKVYAGYDFTDNFALEAGYKDFGKYKFAIPASVAIDGFYVAAKGSVKVSESWTLFGKAGVSHVNVDVKGASLGEFGKYRALLAIGADYSITENLALGLELADYGRRKSSKGNLGLYQFEANLKYSF